MLRSLADHKGVEEFLMVKEMGMLVGFGCVVHVKCLLCLLAFETAEADSSSISLKTRVGD